MSSASDGTKVVSASSASAVSGTATDGAYCSKPSPSAVISPASLASTATAKPPARMPSHCLRTNPNARHPLPSIQRPTGQASSKASSISTGPTGLPGAMTVCRPSDA
ncbi:hypothetical protein [Thermomonas sp.]|uniref:hypothetical protein n=1 Tax=Thermomonas sp. TaxID=1971895 RepID=UPI0035B067FA